jgi:hypothetical protein
MSREAIQTGPIFRMGAGLRPRGPFGRLNERRIAFWRVLSCGSGAGSVEFADVGQVASRADGAAKQGKGLPSVSTKSCDEA